jgi:hypothetical protein
MPPTNTARLLQQITPFSGLTKGRRVFIRWRRGGRQLEEQTAIQTGLRAAEQRLQEEVARLQAG